MKKESQLKTIEPMARPFGQKPREHDRQVTPQLFLEAVRLLSSRTRAGETGVLRMVRFSVRPVVVRDLLHTLLCAVWVAELRQRAGSQGAVGADNQPELGIVHREAERKRVGPRPAVAAGRVRLEAPPGVA
jgi:hypothetical protein